MVEIEERMTGHLLHSRVFCRFFWRVFPSAMLFSAMVWCFGLGSSRRAYGEIDAQIGSALVKAKERYLTLDFDGALALLEDATAQATIQATTPSDYQLLRDLYVERALNYFALSESDAASRSLNIAVSVGFLHGDGTFAPEFQEFVKRTISDRRAAPKGQLSIKAAPSDQTTRNKSTTSKVGLCTAYLNGRLINMRQSYLVEQGPHHFRKMCGKHSEGEIIAVRSGEKKEIALVPFPVVDMSMPPLASKKVISDATSLPPDALSTDATNKARRRWVWPVAGSIAAVALAGTAIGIYAATRAPSGTNIVIAAP